MEEQSIRMPGNATAARTPRPKPHFLRMPAEGEGGVFTQSWFPVALASEVVAGQILGVNFLDGKIVVFRAPDGTPRAMSAYCPHLGADLSVGRIVDGRLQCAFHHWEYDSDGFCVKTGIGDPPHGAAVDPYDSIAGPQSRLRRRRALPHRCDHRLAVERIP